MDSFSVRSICLWRKRCDQTLAYLYEERVTLWQASSIHEALRLAEVEARAYATDEGVDYIDFLQAFALHEAVEAGGVEVFSLLRESALEPDAYVTAFFDTGRERTQHH